MKHHDPITGDELTNAEYVSWHIQNVVRSPWFIVVFNLITLMMMVIGWRDAWNYLASWLAIMVEYVVGLFFRNQTMRDAHVLREVRALVQRLEQQEELVVKDVETLSGNVSPPPSGISHGNDRLDGSGC